MMMFEYKSLLSRFKHVGSPTIIRFLLTCCARQLLKSASSAREFRLSPSKRGEDSGEGICQLADPVCRTLTLPCLLGRERRTHAKQLCRDVAISLGEERARKLAN